LINKVKLVQSQRLNLLKKFFRKILQNSFIKVLSENGIISIAGSILTMISTKVVALIIGTSGVAMIGQLQNFIQISTLISNGGFNQGVTKYIAEDKDDEKSLLKIIGTAFIALFITTILATITILIFSRLITLKIFTSNTYVSIIIIFAFTLIFHNLNSLILAIVNGFQDYSKFFKIKVTTTIVGFALTTTFVLIFNEYGALLAIVLSQSVVCVFAYFYIKNEIWIKAFLFKYFSRQKLLLLLKYTAITVFAAAIWPVVRLSIRTYVINNISAEEAGLWQATANLNQYIVNIAIGSFSVYLLPKLSSITNKNKLIKELIGIYKIIIPITIIGFTAIYLLRDYVIILLYSKEFLKVGHYLLLQMVGSFFWMCKVPIMNYLLAKAHTNIYMINELIFALIYVLLSMFFIPKYEVQGIQLSFAIYNFLYFITNIVLVRKLINM